MRTWVALLRGINVGSHRRVSMPLLREALTAAGYVDVRTYIQSGNVVLLSDHDDAVAVADDVARVVHERFDFDVPVIVRSGQQLAAILAWNPFPTAAAERPKLVQVIHLAREPEPAPLAELLAADVTPDQIAVQGPEIVVAYAESVVRSPTDAPLRRLGIDATARNWRTLTALVHLAGEAE